MARVAAVAAAAAAEAGEDSLSKALRSIRRVWNSLAEAAARAIASTMDAECSWARCSADTATVARQRQSEARFDARKEHFAIEASRALRSSAGKRVVAAASAHSRSLVPA